MSGGHDDGGSSSSSGESNGYPATVARPAPGTAAVAGFTLETDRQGALVLVDGADGTRHAGVHPVRAFPLSAPDEALALVGADGRELRWLARGLGEVSDATTRALVEAALARREFAPRIERLIAVSGFTTPSTWTVQTDRGPAQLVLKGEEDIRRLAAGALLVTDAAGVQYRIDDRFALDRASRRLLGRFL